MEAPSLRADCGACAALCCVTLPFVASADFPFDKPAGVPCRHLASDRCSIHSSLPQQGFHGCVAFDCFGAGQRATAVAGRDGAVFAALLALHELLWYLDEAIDRAPDAALSAARTRVRTVAAGAALTLRSIAPDVERAAVAPLLRAASRAIRGRDGTRAGSDLAGAALRGADLTDEELRGASLLGADLRSARLVRTDLLGADLRGADLRGADLSSALFVTRRQVGGAQVDAATRLPPRLRG